jgi:hypothetical protein
MLGSLRPLLSLKQRLSLFEEMETFAWVSGGRVGVMREMTTWWWKEGERLGGLDTAQDLSAGLSCVWEAGGTWWGETGTEASADRIGQMLFLSMGMETGEESRKRRAKVESMEMNWDAGARVKLVTIAGGCKRGERGIEPRGPIATARAERLCPKRRRSDSKYRVRLVKGRLRSDWVAAKKQRIVLTRMESYCNWDVVDGGWRGGAIFHAVAEDRRWELLEGDRACGSGNGNIPSRQANPPMAASEARHP